MSTAPWHTGPDWPGWIDTETAGQAITAMAGLDRIISCTDPVALHRLLALPPA